MAGGLFAVDRNYFWEIGSYDEQMNGWGGENLEFSFRVWQCGGTLETMPCSHVGHVFRKFHPYKMPNKVDTHGINTARMAEVWMDEYAELFFINRMDLRWSPAVGDVTQRKVLRKKLGCKSFAWYLEHIYPEKFVPVRDTPAYGRFFNKRTELCLDTLLRESAYLGVYECHDILYSSQHFSLSSEGHLRTEEDCAQVEDDRDYDYENSGENITAKIVVKITENITEEISQERKVLLSSCFNDTNQLWTWTDSAQLKHNLTGLCLDARGLEPEKDIMVRPCNNSDTQIWNIEYSERNNYGVESGKKMDEMQRNLVKIRSQSKWYQSRLLRVYNSTADQEKRRNVTKVQVKKTD